MNQFAVTNFGAQNSSVKAMKWLLAETYATVIVKYLIQ